MDSLEFPDGTVYRTTNSAAATEGALVKMEMTLPPDAVAPPSHIHPGQEEEYRVVEGTLDVLLDDSWQQLGAGQSIRVPAGRVHTFANRSGAVVRLINTHRPALSFERYLQRIHTLAATGKLKDIGSPKSRVYVSMLWQEHSDTLLVSNPVQRGLMKAIAVVCRMLRFKLP